MATPADASLRILHSGWSEYPSGTIFGPRRQREWQFVWMTRGSARWTADDVGYRLDGGTIGLSQPGMRDHYAWDGAGSVCHGMVVFASDLAPGLPAVRHSGTDSILLPLLQHIVALDDAAGQREAALRLVLLAWSSGRHVRAAMLEQAVGHPAVDAALDHLRRLWAGPRLSQPSVPVLARQVGVSPNHLIRLFRRELGATPQEAMRLIRLDHAAELVAGSSLTLDDIAQRCGFTDGRHLARWFRLTFGLAPRAYRTRIAAGGAPVYIPLVELRAIARQRLRL